jgi:hypothetical protein
MKVTTKLAFFFIVNFIIIIYSLSKTNVLKKLHEFTSIKQKSFTRIDTANENDTKTLVLYAYFEKNDFYIKTIKFFLKIGVEESTTVDYVFIIQGGTSSVRFPRYQNVRVFKRKNDCFDFGAYGAAIKWLGGITNLVKYTHFIFINPSAIGPILPKYWPSSIHWTEAFISNMKQNVHAVGTSVVCLEYADPMIGNGPRLEGKLLNLIFFQYNQIFYFISVKIQAWRLL